MHRAQVVERISPGWVTLRVPALYRESVIGPIQSTVDAHPGDRVVLADLSGGAKRHDWWVSGFETGFTHAAPDTTAPPGTVAAHTHPVTQVEGLPGALAGKAAVAGAWASLELLPVFVGYGAWSGAQYRTTAAGVQLRGLVRLTGVDLPLDTVIATVPGLALPGELDVQLSVMGPGPGYSASSVQMAVRASGALRTRQVWSAGNVYSFAHTIPV